MWKLKEEGHFSPVRFDYLDMVKNLQNNRVFVRGVGEYSLIFSLTILSPIGLEVESLRTY